MGGHLHQTLSKMLIKWADSKANIFQKRPGLDGQNGRICSRRFGLARGGWTGAGGRRRAGGSDRGRPHKNALFNEKRSFRPFLTISGPSRPQKWIRLEILRNIHPTRGLEVKIEAISWQISETLLKMLIKLLL